MNHAAPVGVVFLGFSVVNLLVHLVALRRMVYRPVAEPAARMTWRGLLRTAVCRVIAALAYVGLGVMTLVAPSAVTALALALLVFMSVQTMWWINAGYDWALNRRLGRLEQETPVKPPRPFWWRRKALNAPLEPLDDDAPRSIKDADANLARAEAQLRDVLSRLQLGKGDW